MSRLAVVCVSVAIVTYLTSGCNAHRIYYDDLDVAASDHHEYKKGEESDHHESGFKKHGKKGDEGYDEKHR